MTKIRLKNDKGHFRPSAEIRADFQAKIDKLEEGLDRKSAEIGSLQSSAAAEIQMERRRGRKNMILLAILGLIVGFLACYVLQANGIL